MLHLDRLTNIRLGWKGLPGTYFHISVTFEMRTSEYVEICISIDDQTIAERAFKRNEKMGKESKVAEGQREIECVCASVDQN